MKRLFGLVWLSLLLSAAASGCVYDDANRCGPNQHIISNDRCACDDGYVPGSAGCIPCAEHERSINGECACVSGYARSNGAVCEPIPVELGVACDGDSAGCSGNDYPLCHPTDAGSGYCTAPCQSDADCNGGYKCHQDGSASFCRRPPIGFGDSCKSDRDCAAGEATFCEQIQRNICLVPCEAGKTDVCFEGEVCCDFALFHPICVPGAACGDNGGTEVQ